MKTLAILLLLTTSAAAQQAYHYGADGRLLGTSYTDSQGKFTFRFPVAPGPLDVCVSAHHQGKRVGKWHQIVVGPEPRTELVFELSLTEGNAGQPSPDPR